MVMKIFNKTIFKSLFHFLFAKLLRSKSDRSNDGKEKNFLELQHELPPEFLTMAKVELALGTSSFVGGQAAVPDW